MEYWKDGKKVELGTIFSKGKVGQVVVLDHVGYGKNPDPNEYPLARYPQPYAFTIVEKVEGKNGYYVVMDADGNHITLRDPYYGASEPYLYDGNEWLAWRKEETKEKMARKDRRIAHLESQIALLRGILIAQGPKVITETQAKQLGLK